VLESKSRGPGVEAYRDSYLHVISRFQSRGCQKLWVTIFDVLKSRTEGLNTLCRGIKG